MDLSDLKVSQRAGGLPRMDDYGLFFVDVVDLLNNDRVCSVRETPVVGNDLFVLTQLQWATQYCKHN